jgi:hypothetical protein
MTQMPILQDVDRAHARIKAMIRNLGPEVAVKGHSQDKIESSLCLAVTC